MSVSRVILGNSSRNTKSGDIVVKDSIRISREIYQKLGSFVKNKQLSTEYTLGSVTGSYKEFLDNMDNLFLGKPCIDGTKEIDEYLGSLGVTHEYPYNKDTLSINAWIDIETRSPYRYLIDTKGNYLIDSSDNSILIHYNKEA